MSQTLFPQPVSWFFAMSVSTCSCSHAIFIIYEKNMVSHMIESIKYLVIVVYDWIIQDSIIVLFCGSSRRGCTTSLMHEFSKATDAVLVPREALSFMNGQDMIYNGARVRYNFTDTPQDFIFCETCGMGTNWLGGLQPF